MQLREINCLEQYLKPFDRCKGRIYMVSKQGDIFNLNSKLGQLQALDNLLNALEGEYDLVCTNEEDKEYLRKKLFFTN